MFKVHHLASDAHDLIQTETVDTGEVFSDPNEGNSARRVDEAFASTKTRRTRRREYDLRTILGSLPTDVRRLQTQRRVLGRRSRGFNTIK